MSSTSSVSPKLGYDPAARGRNAAIAFGIVIGALLVNGLLTWLNVRQMREVAAGVAHTHEVLGELRLLAATVVDAESGQRGFLITGAPEYLELYRSAVEQIEPGLARLARLVADNPKQRADVRELQTLVARRLDLIRHNIALRESQGFAAARDMILTGEGKIIMDDIRVVVARLEERERALLVRREETALASYWTALTTALVAAVLGVVLAIAGYVLVLRDIRTRNRTVALMQETNERLETRVRERTAALSALNAELAGQISVRQQAEEQAFQFALDLQRSNRELEQFASVASHDLQEPLRKIQAFGDRLRGQFRETLGDQGRDYLDRMLASAGRMRQLIDDLLDYSRVTTRGKPFTMVKLSAVGEAVLSDLEGQLQRTGGTVELGELPTISADPQQMRRLFQNLISNALKFHRPDVPPLVRVTAREIAAGSASEVDGSAPAWCELTFADNGIGFEAQYAERIFELFQRLHGRDEFEGTGMGLAICKKIVERHGGSISAQGEPGQGSRFVVRLPRSHEPPGEPT
ncbi:MAG: CHASE3 domain-containing protein [Pirellulaceae bacterium]|nr:CHASE3 domain-containing protein [Pirellulaceae bacterium]